MSLRLALVGSLALLLVGPATAGPQQPSDAQLRARQCLAQIAVAQAIDRLHISRDQFEKILPLAQQSAQEAEAITKAQTDHEADYAAALTKLRTEVLANNGVADETKAAVHKAKMSCERLEDAHTLADRDRARQISDIIGDQFTAARPQRPGRARARAQAKAKADPERARAAVAKLFLSPWAAPIIEIKLGQRKAADLPAPTGYQPSADLVKLETDIRVLNLVNSLYLTADEMTKMEALIHQAQPIIEQRQAAVTRAAETALPELTAARAKVLAGEALPRGKDRGRALLNVEADYARRLSPLVEQTKALLTDNQKVLVAEFIPCLVPVRSLTNPERVGQANDDEGAIRLLTRVRELPEARVPRAIETAERRMSQQMAEKHMSDKDIEAAKKRLESAFHDARAMTDAQFEVNKSELAKQIGRPARPPAEGNAFDQRVAWYLLNPNLLPIYDQRIAAEGA
jgi:hypothetical protein